MRAFQVFTAALGCLLHSSIGHSDEAFTKPYRLTCTMGEFHVRSSAPDVTTEAQVIEVPAVRIIDGRPGMADIPDVPFELNGFTGMVRVNKFFTGLFIDHGSNPVAEAYFPASTVPQPELTPTFPLIVGYRHGYDIETTVQCEINEVSS